MHERSISGIKKIFFIVLIFTATFNLAACGVNSTEVIEVITTSQITASETAATQISEETGSKQSTTDETDSEESTKKLLGDQALNFIDAVKSGNEYDYVSSATKEIVGTEQEYKNGTKSDIYFIIT